MRHRDRDEITLTCCTAMYHDMMRSLEGGKPFMLMESMPGAINWQPTSELKKPGTHILPSLQAVAHSADSVQYFRWRKGRGSAKEFRGVVVDHVGHIDTRIGRRVSQLGEILSKPPEVRGCRTEARIAVIFDQQSRWVPDDAQGPRNLGMEYERTASEYCHPFREQGIVVDMVDAGVDLTPYRLMIASMLYIVYDSFTTRAEMLATSGGHLVTTCRTGIINKSDLCYLGGFPDLPRNLLGTWAEEIDCLNDGEFNPTQGLAGNQCGLQGPYQMRHLCELVHTESAQTLAAYRDDFYAGRPAVTVNSFGKDKA